MTANRTNVRGYEYDAKNSFVIHTDDDEYIKHMAERKKFTEDALLKERVAQLEARVEELERLIREKNEATS